MVKSKVTVIVLSEISSLVYIITESKWHINLLQRGNPLKYTIY